MVVEPQKYFPRENLKFIFLSFCFMLNFKIVSSPHKEGPWAKVIKSFATLSIYKTLIPKYVRQKEIHYVFDKEEDYILFQGIATFPSTRRKLKK